MSTFATSHAAVIGIDAYQGSVAPLRTAVADATAVARVLAEEHGYAPPRLLLDADATRERLDRLFGVELPSVVGPDDRLLVYFAGHGIARGDGAEGPQGYLLPHGADAADEVTWLSMERLRGALEGLACRHLLVVLDCCFAGSFRWASTRSFAPKARLYDSQYQRFLQGTAWQVLTSAAHHQLALDVLPGRHNLRDDERREDHSPFAAALLRGLGGGADSARAGFEPDGVITATELYQYVSESLAADGAPQTPGLWPLTPESVGEFVFHTPGAPTATRPDPPLDDAANPWRGLAAYTEDDAGLYFGRDGVAAELRRRLEDGDAPLVAVVGASGSGKSSLVRAGLLPRLDGFTVVVAPRFESVPRRQLEDALARLDAANGRRLLVVDQFEELYTQCAEPTLQDDALALLLRRLDGGGLTMLITLRSDFEARLAAAPGFERLLDEGRFVVPAPGRDELRQVIERPAAAQALYFEPPGLVDRLLDEVAALTAPLPLLSFVLAEMYRRAVLRRRATGEVDRALTVADFAATGGVAGALHRRASELYGGAGPRHRATLRRLFLRLVSLEGGRPTRRRIVRRELDFADPEEASRVEEALDELAAARLLVTDGDTVEPAHDTLVEAWHQLAIWLSEDTGGLTLRRSAWRDALDWEASDFDPLLLWDRDPRLPQLEAAWDELNRLEQSFVAASRRRRQARARWLTAGSAALGGVLLGLAGHAFKKARLAERRLRDAVAVADEIVQVVDGELRPVTGTAAVRRRLLDASSRLLDRLRRGAARDRATLKSRLLSHLRRGDLAKSHDELGRVEEEYAAAVAIAERLAAADPADAESRYDLALARRKVAGTALDQGHRVRASEELESSRRLLEDLAAEHPEDRRYRRDLAVTLNQLGAVAEARGEWDAAQGWYERSLGLKRVLEEEDPEDLELAYDLVISYDKLGAVAQARDEWDAARGYYEEGLRLKEDCARREPHDDRWPHALAWSHERLGGLAEELGDLDAAEPAYERSLAIRRRLAAADPDNSYRRRDVAESVERLGDVARVRGERDAARRFYEEALAIRRTLVELDPRRSVWRRQLAALEDRCQEVSGRSDVSTGVGEGRGGG